MSRDLRYKTPCSGTFQPVTISQVYQFLTSLSSNKATGVDKISSKIIKIASPAIADSLTHIFNQAVTLSSFPDEWKTARVVPLYKNGQRNLAGNYTPISVLPVISKIMEKILYDQLYNYLSNFNLSSVIINLVFENFILQPQHYLTVQMIGIRI